MRKIEPAILDEALKAVYDHHDGLRLRLRGGRLHYVEVEAPTVEWGNESDMESYAEAIQTGLNFEHGPVFRVAGFRSDKEDSVKLLFVAHHMVVDICPGAFCLRIYGRPIPRHPTPPHSVAAKIRKLSGLGKCPWSKSG